VGLTFFLHREVFGSPKPGITIWGTGPARLIFMAFWTLDRPGRDRLGGLVLSVRGPSPYSAEWDLAVSACYFLVLRFGFFPFRRWWPSAFPLLVGGPPLPRGRCRILALQQGAMSVRERISPGVFGNPGDRPFLPFSWPRLPATSTHGVASDVIVMGPVAKLLSHFFTLPLRATNAVSPMARCAKILSGSVRRPSFFVRPPVTGFLFFRAYGLNTFPGHVFPLPALARPDYIDKTRAAFSVWVVAGVGALPHTVTARAATGFGQGAWRRGRFMDGCPVGCLRRPVLAPVVSLTS